VLPAPGVAALSVRTRLPGDRVSVSGREMSLKRFLMQERVPRSERAFLPLVASGSRVLWVPGRPATARPAATGPRVRVTLETCA